MADDALDPFVLAEVAERALLRGDLRDAAQLFLVASRWALTPEGKAELVRKAVDAACQAGHELARPA